MKSCFGSAASLLAALSLLNGGVGVVNAIEHPLLTSTDDFRETWKERPVKKDMISLQKELRYTKFIDHSQRPVVGVLTEPLRGDLYKKGAINVNDKVDRGVEKASPGYVPRAHVQFLEQAGVRVVPIDYRLERDDLVALFDQLNGLYLPGDSQMAVTDEKYKGAFVIAMAYAENEAFEEKKHWPVFLMGNSLSTWIRSKQSESGVLSDMGSYKHTNSRIDLVEHPDDTYLFNKMTREEKQAMFNTAQFFNMQVTGLRPIDLKYQKALTRHLRPLALYTGHGIENDEEKFIAIAEGAEMPIYAFTYGIELV